MVSNPGSRSEKSGLVSVVTGAAGFVGQALVRRLLADGDHVRAIVLPADPVSRELPALCGDCGRLEIIEGDVSDYDTIAPAFAGARRVFHAAALVHAWVPRQQFWMVNVTGAQNVARAALAHRLERLVALSTSDVFGLPDGDRVLDESCPLREWGEPYADSKIAAERWLWQCARDTGLPLSVIYPGWVYGPGDRAFFPALARALRDGSMLFWHRDTRLPWVYIDNLVDACLLASTHPEASGHGYLIFDTIEGPSLEEVCARIADTIGARPAHLHLPYTAAYATAWLLQSLWRLVRARNPPPLQTVDVKAFGFQWHLSNHKARQHLGWSSRVSVEDGMQRALDHLAACLPGRR
jgi:nucleoside-diphosphate-sugar epimerase